MLDVDGGCSGLSVAGFGSVAAFGKIPFCRLTSYMLDEFESSLYDNTLTSSVCGVMGSLNVQVSCGEDFLVSQSSLPTKIHKTDKEIANLKGVYFLIRLFSGGNVMVI